MTPDSIITSSDLASPHISDLLLHLDGHLHFFSHSLPSYQEIRLEERRTGKMVTQGLSFRKEILGAFRSDLRREILHGGKLLDQIIALGPQIVSVSTSLYKLSMPNTEMTSLTKDSFYAVNDSDGQVIGLDAKAIAARLQLAYDLLTDARKIEISKKGDHIDRGGKEKRAAIIKVFESIPKLGALDTREKSRDEIAAEINRLAPDAPPPRPLAKRGGMSLSG